VTIKKCDYGVVNNVSWRERSAKSWRGRLAVMASRGEVSGPRVTECQAALSNWRLRNFLIKEWGYTERRADALIDLAATTKAPEER
jgi:hypothetical protein